MNKIEKLADDFSRWGKAKVKRVQAGVKKHGVIFNSWTNTAKTKG